MGAPGGRKRLKGLQAEEGLPTLDISFAVDPHGSRVHGSRPAPTCWIRRASGREAEKARLPEARRPASRLPSADPHTRAVETPGPLAGLPGPDQVHGSEEEGERHTPEAAAVEDLKTRHAAAAPRRAPRLLTPHVPTRKPRPLLAPHVPPQATPPRAASHASPSRGPRPLRPVPAPPRPSPPRCPLPQIRARRPAAGRPCAVRRRLRGPVSTTRRWMQ